MRSASTPRKQVESKHHAWGSPCLSSPKGNAEFPLLGGSGGLGLLPGSCQEPATRCLHVHTRTHTRLKGSKRFLARAHTLHTHAHTRLKGSKRFPAVAPLAHPPSSRRAGRVQSPGRPRPLAGPERAPGPPQARGGPLHTRRAAAAREACAARATHRLGPAGGRSGPGGRGRLGRALPGRGPCAPCVLAGARRSRPGRGSFNPGRGAGRRGGGAAPRRALSFFFF